MRTDGAAVCAGAVAITLSTPDVDRLGEVVEVLRQWQVDGAPIQLHPGDLGWFWRFGAAATASAVRTWSHDGRVLGIGLLDGPDLLRLALAPQALRDEDLGRQVVGDVVQPERGVLPPGPVSVEAPSGAVVDDLLVDAGWRSDESWTLLRRDLTDPVDEPGVRVEAVEPERARVWAAVHRAAFDPARLTDDVVHRRWQAMAAGAPFADGRCLLAHDDGGHAVAVVTVWSAGPGRYGLIEPMGVHPAHRGRGHGRAITTAGAAALRELGSSAAIVATPSSRVGAVATYASAGFAPVLERLDRRRDV